MGSSLLHVIGGESLDSRLRGNDEDAGGNDGTMAASFPRKRESSIRPMKQTAAFHYLQHPLHLLNRIVAMRRQPNRPFPERMTDTRRS